MALGGVNTSLENDIGGYISGFLKAFTLI